MFYLVPVGKRAVDFRGPITHNPLSAEPATYEFDSDLSMHGTALPNKSETMLGFYGVPLAEKPRRG